MAEKAQNSSLEGFNNSSLSTKLNMNRKETGTLSEHKFCINNDTFQPIKKCREM